MGSKHNAVAEIYHPLDPAKRQVRFMRMQHTQNIEIYCELRTFSLDDQPEYEALSYAWTNAKPVHNIHLNGAEFYVRPNLFEYLKLMKREAHHGWIFIDALCINQSDVVERESQVNLMGSIYSNACEVTAWLGVKGRLGEQLVDDESRQKWQTTCDSQERIDSIFCKTGEQPSEDSLVDIFIEAFCNGEYWSRLWILQEIVLSKRLRLRFCDLTLQPDILLFFTFGCMKILFGHRYCEDSRFREHVDLNVTYVGYTVSRSYPIRQPHARNGWVLRARNVLLARQNMLERSTKVMHLYVGVSAFTHHECTEPHDKIYGLLGLLHSDLKADYSLPLLELYVYVLAEGIMNWWPVITAIISSDSVDDNDIDNAYNVLIVFCTALLRALKFRPYDPIVSLAMDTVSRYFGSTGQLVKLVLLSRFCLTQCRGRGSRSMNSFSSRLYYRILRLFTRISVYHYRTRRSSKLRGCKGYGYSAMTAEAWTKRVEDICMSVKNASKDNGENSWATADIVALVKTMRRP